MNNQTWAVDRLEGAFAVLEETATHRLFDCPVTGLPPDIKEGDILKKDADGMFFIDGEETRKRKARARGLMERLKKRYH